MQLNVSNVRVQFVLMEGRKYRFISVSWFRLLCCQLQNGKIVGLMPKTLQKHTINWIHSKMYILRFVILLCCFQRRQISYMVIAMYAKWKMTSQPGYKFSSVSADSYQNVELSLRFYCSIVPILIRKRRLSEAERKRHQHTKNTKLQQQNFLHCRK